MIDITVDCIKSIGSQNTPQHELLFIKGNTYKGKVYGSKNETYLLTDEFGCLQTVPEKLFKANFNNLNKFEI